jgi:hypothetical protein
MRQRPPTLQYVVLHSPIATPTTPPHTHTHTQLHSDTAGIIAYPKGVQQHAGGRLAERLRDWMGVFWISTKQVYVQGSPFLLGFAYLLRVKSSAQGTGIAAEATQVLSTVLQHWCLTTETRSERARERRTNQSIHPPRGMRGAGAGLVHVRNRSSLRFNLKSDSMPTGMVGSHLIRLGDLAHAATQLSTCSAPLVVHRLSVQETHRAWAQRFGTHNLMPVRPEEVTGQRQYAGTFSLTGRAGSSAGVSVWLPADYAQVVDPVQRTEGERGQMSRRGQPFALLFNVWAHGPSGAQLFVSLLARLCALIPGGAALSHLVTVLWRTPIREIHRAVYNANRVHRLEWEDCFRATALERLVLDMAAGSEYEYYSVGQFMGGARRCHFADLVDPFTDPRDCSTLVSFHRTIAPRVRALL